MTEKQTDQTGPRVLVVDDNDAILRAHARALAHKGYQVETAIDGATALRALESASFDVILSDIDMPGMTGIQLLERVRERDLDVRVVMITGSPSMETAIKAMERGALRYLVKPVELEALLKVRAEAVSLHRLAKATWRVPFRRRRRLAPTDGFFEWTSIPGGHR